MKIYVASSWSNKQQQSVINKLKAEEFDVYDFHNPIDGNYGFHWLDIDPHCKAWTIEKYRRSLDHPIVIKSYCLDRAAMEECNIFLGVRPFGRDASIEMGWAAGQGKKTILLLSDD